MHVPHCWSEKKSYPNSPKRKASFNTMYKSREVTQLYTRTSLLQRNSNRIFAIILNLICVFCKTWIANDFVLVPLGIWILPEVKTAVIEKKSEIIVWSWIRKKNLKESQNLFTNCTVQDKLDNWLGTLLLVPSWKKGIQFRWCQNRSHWCNYLGLVSVPFWSFWKSFCGFTGSAFLRFSVLDAFFEDLTSSSLRKSLKLESDFYSRNNAHK